MPVHHNHHYTDGSALLHLPGPSISTNYAYPPEGCVLLRPRTRALSPHLCVRGSWTSTLCTFHVDQLTNAARQASRHVPLGYCSAPPSNHFPALSICPPMPACQSGELDRLSCPGPPSPQASTKGASPSTVTGAPALSGSMGRPYC